MAKKYTSKGQSTAQKTLESLSSQEPNKDFVELVPPRPTPITPQQAGTPSITGFGLKSQDIASYPNDVVRLDLSNNADTYLGTDYRISGWSSLKQNNTLRTRQLSITDAATPDNITINLNVDEDVQRLGYVAGRYKLTYKFHRNILGSGDGHKLVIQEINSTGLEIRVRPVLSQTIDNTQFVQYFQDGLFKTPKSSILSNLFLFESFSTSTPVFDYVQDKFTVNEAPYSIIIKLSAPLSTAARVGTELWLAQQLSTDFPTETTLTPPDIAPPTTTIAGPNFDVLAKKTTGISTQYKDSEDLITSDANISYQLQDRIISSSLSEGIDINTDFRKFENFVKYSSAQDRLDAFKNKVQLIERYDSQISTLTTDLNGLPDSGASSSAAYLSNVTTARTKKSATIGSFDAYERHLYYSSASYETSSFGDFWPSTWPKQNNSQPYTLYSVTSSQAVDWFRGALSSASLYDNDNIDALTKSVPSHIVEDDNNETYTTFVSLAGNYFDDIVPYIREYTERYNHTQKVFEGLSRDLLFILGENLGFEFENGASLDDLWSYTLGTDATGSIDTIYNTTPQDTIKELWKRLLVNMPYLLRTKGTERCLRALINIFGIPETILRIKEYGGHEGSFDTKSDLVYDRFYYAFVAGYNGQTSGLPAQQVKVPWQAVSQSGLFPQTTELRVRMADNQTKDQTIAESPGLWKIKAFQDGGDKYVGFFLSGSQGWATSSVSSSIYDTDTEDPYTDQDTRWHHIALRREAKTDTITDNQTYTLIVKTTKYNKVVSTATASLSVDGSISSSYNNSFTTTADVWIPGSGSYALADSHSMDLFSGSVQEFRYWTSELQDAILDNHTLAPTSFQGNTDRVFTGSTSSFDTLAYRLTLGTDNKTTLDDHYPATSSFNSQHPNQGATVPSSSFYNITSSAYYRVIEQNSLEWPDLGANRSISTKVRIDTTNLVDKQLFHYTKVEKPLSDNNPPDSPKLGVFLSPMNEVNQDIAEQFGGISLDDYIGDPSQLYLDDYPDLQDLARVYSKKYTSTNKPMQYVRLMKHYNAALFQLIKRLVPHRANMQTGLLIEPTILERSKIATPPPIATDLTLTASLDLNPAVLFKPTGEVEDGHNEPFYAQADYVKEGTIGGDQSDYLEITGSALEILPFNNEASISLAILDPKGVYSYQADNILNPIDILQDNDVSGVNYSEIDGTLDMAITATGYNSRYNGSKYIYMTWQQNGLGTVADPYTLAYVTASRYDAWDPINPTIMTSRFSEQSSPDNFKYQKDIWNYHSLESYYTASNNTEFSSSTAVQENDWTRHFGLEISSSYAGTTPYATPYLSGAGEPVWILSGSRGGVDGSAGPFNGLNFEANNSVFGPYTGSVLLDSFFNEREDADTTNYAYRVRGTIVTAAAGTPGFIGKVVFQAGREGSAYSQTYSINTTPSKNYTDFDFITRADGSELVITAQASSNSGFFICLQDLKIQPLNYFESVQDYHLWNAKGMVNARYEGCKLTSTDYNVDSPDTVDGGPVITITEGGGKELISRPARQRGTFEIR